MAKAKKVGYAAYRLSPLKKITDLAKQIRKKNPSMKYTDAVKKAGAQYRAGKTAAPAARKAAPKKKPAVKKYKSKQMAKASPSKQGALFGASNNAIGSTYSYNVSVRNGAESKIKDLSFAIAANKKKLATKISQKEKMQIRIQNGLMRDSISNLKKTIRLMNTAIVKYGSAITK